MNMKRVSISLFATLFFSICVCLNSGSVSASGDPDLIYQQSNAINMLNYLRMFTQEIQTSSNSRIYVEEAYSSLINNTNPNAVDPQTLEQVLSLLDTLEGYRIIDVFRERSELIYNQRKAEAIWQVLPEPVGMLNVTEAMNKPFPAKQMAVAYVGVSAVAAYKEAVDAAEEQYLRDSWEISDKEAEQLHNMRKEMYSYMVNMVNSYELDGSLALNEEAINDFVEWKNNDNNLRKIQFFEANEKTYKAFGPYWLELAGCYFENEDYEKTLGAIDKYEDLEVQIFRKDYDYAKAMPVAIAAAEQLYDGEEYAKKVEDYCDAIINNSSDEEWELRMIAAQTYQNLYGETDNKEYLDKAYDIVLNNVNVLVDEQHSLNEKYLSNKTDVSSSGKLSKSQKDAVKKLNSKAKDQRKTELAPVYEPLVLNLNMLKQLSDEKNISEEEAERVDKMLHGTGDALFLTIPVENVYLKDKLDINPEEINIAYGGDKVVLPVQYVTDSTEIAVTVTGEEKTEIVDWEVSSVKRKEKDDLSTFMVTFKSKEAK